MAVLPLLVLSFAGSLLLPYRFSCHSNELCFFFFSFIWAIQKVCYTFYTSRKNSYIRQLCWGQRSFSYSLCPVRSNSSLLWDLEVAKVVLKLKLRLRPDIAKPLLIQRLSLRSPRAMLSPIFCPLLLLYTKLYSSLLTIKRTRPQCLFHQLSSQ